MLDSNEILERTVVDHQLCIIEDLFDISGRGIVIVPWVPKDAAFPVRIGDRLVLKRPDGSQIHSHVRGLDQGRHPNRHRGMVGQRGLSAPPRKGLTTAKSRAIEASTSIVCAGWRFRAAAPGPAAFLLS